MPVLGPGLHRRDRMGILELETGHRAVYPDRRRRALTGLPVTEPAQAMATSVPEQTASNFRMRLSISTRVLLLLKIADVLRLRDPEVIGQLRARRPVAVGPGIERHTSCRSRRDSPRRVAHRSPGWRFFRLARSSGSATTLNRNLLSPILSDFSRRRAWRAAHWPCTARTACAARAARRRERRQQIHPVRRRKPVGRHAGGRQQRRQPVHVDRHCSVVAPAGIRAGQRTIAGIRRPPSSNSIFMPVNGQLSV